ncbi:MAG TPA: Hsp20/alpha crystallin family protein [Candidatus Methylacidiphilales bacterium]|nr:Hsp20/alpha crystallin family protein [Candidatus Methylacidiphilales bacterium]
MWNPTLSANDNTWNQLNQFHQRMDQLFADTFAQSGLGGTIDENLGFTVPSMDLRDEKDHYTVRMDMPGADKGTIKVNVGGSLLSVSGQRETSNETKDSGNQVIRSERSTAQFERTISLPTPVKPESVTADYTNGVLTINLPKSDKVAEATNVTVQ